MALSPGDKLGPYEIVESIGKGGMGEVFRARDTRLNRDVALKISSAQFTERFEREARAVAALNHPHICTLYDVATSPDGFGYLVMEYIEGVAPRGPLPLDEAVAIARQISDALEAAHEKGITHRDLKPANIKIKPDGTVKVLDFGLAKVSSPMSGEAPSENSPTLSMAATQAGVILGTAGYMSPEQASGMPADKRADIFAFGVVFYELLTGPRLFAGETLSHTLASILKDEPDWEAVPFQVQRLLKNCLEKDPKKRLRDIADVWKLWDERASGGAGAGAPPRSSARQWILAALAFAGIAAASTLAILHFRETPPVLQAVQFNLDAPDNSSYADQFCGYAPSPDGRSVILSIRLANGSISLWVRSLDSLKARPLPGAEGGNCPTWSPDSKSLIFTANGKIKRLDIAGGAPLTLADDDNAQVSPTGTWNREGVILFGGRQGLQRMSASGGGTTLLTKADPAKKESGHGYPQFLPDGNRFLYFVDSSDEQVRGVYASSLTNPNQRQLIIRTSTKAVYVPPRAGYPGYLLWLQEPTLLAQRFEQASLKLEGDPISVADEVGLNPSTPVRAAYWASDTGLLIYFANAVGSSVPLAWIGRDGKALGDAAPDDYYRTIGLAPDGERIAVERTDAASGRSNRDIWILERGVPTRLTFDPGADQFPVWSPDGKQITFASDREGGVRQVFRKDASGAGREERLTDGPNPKFPVDWSRDGKFILYVEGSGTTGQDLMALPLQGDKKPIPVVNTPFNENAGAISPDGRWVAYRSNESGRYELYVQAFPGGGDGPKGRWQVSSIGAVGVRWRGDGKELYFESPDGKVMAAGIQSSAQGIHSDAPKVLFSAAFRPSTVREFDVTSDGQRFLMLLNPRGQASTERLTVVSNWQAALRK